MSFCLTPARCRWRRTCPPRGTPPGASRDLRDPTDEIHIGGRPPHRVSTTCHRGDLRASGDATAPYGLRKGGSRGAAARKGRAGGVPSEEARGQRGSGARHGHRGGGSRPTQGRCWGCPSRSATGVGPPWGCPGVALCRCRAAAGPPWGSATPLPPPPPPGVGRLERSRETARLWKKKTMETDRWDPLKRMELVAKHPNLSLEFLSGISSTWSFGVRGVGVMPNRL
jgi:hypothetical protein